jgi:hypothetical protein
LKKVGAGAGLGAGKAGKGVQRSSPPPPPTRRHRSARRCRWARPAPGWRRQGRRRGLAPMTRRRHRSGDRPRRDLSVDGGKAERAEREPTGQVPVRCRGRCLRCLQNQRSSQAFDLLTAHRLLLNPEPPPGQIDEMFSRPLENPCLGPAGQPFAKADVCSVKDAGFLLDGTKFYRNSDRCQGRRQAPRSGRYGGGQTASGKETGPGRARISLSKRLLTAFRGPPRGLGGTDILAPR